jgi:hypothetical protein
MTDKEKSTTETDSTDASNTDHTAAGAVHTAIRAALARLRRVLTYSTTAADQRPPPIVADGGQSDAKVIGHNTDSSGQTVGVWGEVDSADGCGLATPDDARIDGTLLTNATDFTVQAGTTTTEDAQNIVAGHASNSVTDGAVGATIAGGGSDDGLIDRANVVHDNYGTVGGGGDNQAGSDDADPSTARYATVGGGYRNTASDTFATVGGGRSNTANDVNATVGGGVFNTASDTSATVGGGFKNTASARNATVGGGFENTASDNSATVGGGEYNDALASHATIAGGGSTDDTDSTGNVVYDNYGTVGGGGNNQAGSDDGNASTTEYATVGGGEDNTASGSGATVAGGTDNTASNAIATVGGGSFNAASGIYATVPGGRLNTADGSYSFAAGRQADTNGNDGAVVFGDSTATGIQAQGADEIRSQMPMYAPAFNTTSARSKKTNIESVDPQTALDGVASLDIHTWELDHQADGRHMGPMAGEFQETFGLGTDEDSIASVDADGVLFAAVQALSTQLDDRDDLIDDQREQIEELEAEAKRKDELIDAQQAQIDNLESRLERLEAHLDAQPADAS